MKVSALTIPTGTNFRDRQVLALMKLKPVATLHRRLDQKLLQLATSKSARVKDICITDRTFRTIHCNPEIIEHSVTAKATCQKPNGELLEVEAQEMGYHYVRVPE